VDKLFLKRLLLH